MWCCPDWEPYKIGLLILSSLGLCCLTGILMTILGGFFYFHDHWFYPGALASFIFGLLILLAFLISPLICYLGFQYRRRRDYYYLV